MTTKSCCWVWRALRSYDVDRRIHIFQSTVLNAKSILKCVHTALTKGHMLPTTSNVTKDYDKSQKVSCVMN